MIIKGRKLKLSVVILTKNESSRIHRCLDSIKGWADEIIVIDDNSIDKTRQIAAEMGARVIQKKMEVEGKHRNWAYAQAKHEWVLSLDADEVLTPELKEEIERVLKSNTSYNGFTIPRKNFIGDYWLKWGGFYPSSQLKLFKKSKFRWEEVEVHPRAFLEGECGHLTKDLLHYTYRNFSDFLAKLNNQTTLEAQKWFNVYKENPRKASYKMNLGHTLWRTIDRFIRTFLVKKGYRDGFIGFMVAIFAGFYQLLSYAKYWEIRRKSIRKNQDSFL